MLFWWTYLGGGGHREHQGLRPSRDLNLVGLAGSWEQMPRSRIQTGRALGLGWSSRCRDENSQVSLGRLHAPSQVLRCAVSHHTSNQTEPSMVLFHFSDGKNSENWDSVSLRKFHKVTSLTIKRTGICTWIWKVVNTCWMNDFLALRCMRFLLQLRKNMMGKSVPHPRNNSSHLYSTYCYVLGRYISVYMPWFPCLSNLILIWTDKETKAHRDEVTRCRSQKGHGHDGAGI